MGKRVRLLASRKGEEGTNKQMLFFIQIVIALFVLFSLVAYVYSLANNTIFEKVVLAKDTAFLIDTIWAAPGNVQYSYKTGNIDLKKFDIRLDGGIAKVSDASTKEKLHTQQPFSTDTLHTFQAQPLISQDEIIFDKTGGTFRVSK